MRFMTSVAAASLVALLALQPQHRAAAQTPPAGASAAVPGAATATPPATSPATPRAGRRQSLVKRFAAANTTHDGHLTLDQASASNWNYVVKNFDGIDKDHKGYVSVADIRAYSAAQRAARRAAAPANTKG